MRNDPKIEMLRRVPALAGYRDKELGQLAALVDEMTVPSGFVLTEQGRPGRQAYLVVNGQATVAIDGKVVATVGAGQFVGEMSLLEHEPCSATVTAISPMEVLVMDPRSFGAVLSDASMAKRLATSLATRLREQEGAPTYK